MVHKLAVEVHEMTLKLPRFEMYEESSQIRRSSKSIKSNIVEGFGRKRYKQEFIKFLTYALASCDETIDHLDTLYATKALKDKKRYRYFCEEYDHPGRMITNFIKSVDSGHRSKTNIEHRESKIHSSHTSYVIKNQAGRGI
jgi:four helix bundle protein